VPDHWVTKLLQRIGVLADAEQAYRFDEVDQQIDHMDICRCELKGVDENTDFVGGCQPHKAKPASTECAPHMHGFVRREA